jgi:hypothetical protein
MTNINYFKCTIEELNDVLRHIDTEAYPERVLEVERHLKIKLSDPELVWKESYKHNFFNLHIPEGLVTSIWLRFIGWGLVFNVIVIIPLAIVLSLILGIIGVGEYWVTSLSAAICWLVSFPVSWLAMRKAIGAKFRNYEVSILKKEN